MTDIIEEPEQLRREVWEYRRSSEVVGFVPTMGSLHSGHRRVIREARSNNERVVVSIFVNPTQFDTDRDAEVYPRDRERDREILREEDVDLALIPDYGDIYPDGDVSSVSVDLPMTDRYEGEIRPRFFDGVARIVSKLLNIVPAHHAYFGEKDLQQYIMLKRMVKDLHFPQKLHPVPVKRDENGVAYSSRNRNFSEEDWSVARRVHEVMQEIKNNSDSLDRNELTKRYEPDLEEEGIELQYLDVVSYPEYEPTSLDDDSAVLIIAGYIGDVRLKDNLPIHYESIRELEN